MYDPVCLLDEHTAYHGVSDTRLSAMKLHILTAMIVALALACGQEVCFTGADRPVPAAPGPGSHRRASAAAAHCGSSNSAATSNATTGSYRGPRSYAAAGSSERDSSGPGRTNYADRHTHSLAHADACPEDGRRRGALRAGRGVQDEVPASRQGV